MQLLDELLEECGRLHGHMCAGQLLGARMALLGCRLVGIEDPRGADRKKLIVWVEIDRCMADARHPEIESKKERQFLTYREAADEELFKVERVLVEYGEMDMPGRPRSRVLCARCGEGVNDGREVAGPEGSVLCRPCASGGYYRRL